jgi:hypothetical protein
MSSIVRSVSTLCPRMSSLAPTFAAAMVDDGQGARSLDLDQLD